MGIRVHLAELTWEEFSQAVRACSGTVIIPVGSTEQHGGHLPLGTDTLVALAVAAEAALREPALVAPPLWYGWSPHHMVLPGTITVRPEVLIEIGYDIMASLAAHGCRNFVLLNGHRLVNIAWLQIAAERAQRVLGVRVVIFDPAYMSKEVVRRFGFGPIGHADEMESSHMWHCYAELYHAERSLDFVPPRDSLYRVDPSSPDDTLCYVPSTTESMQESVRRAKGTIGSPTKASREKGKEYHNHLVSRLVTVLRELKSGQSVLELEPQGHMSAVSVTRGSRNGENKPV